MTKQSPTKGKSSSRPKSHFKRNLIVIIFALIGAFFFALSQKLGYLTTLQNFPEDSPNCIYHENQMIGPEDMTKIRENVAVGIAHDTIQLSDLGGVPATSKGLIWAYYFDTKTSYLLEPENFPKEANFFPHGIFFDSKTERLHVLNHPYQGLGDRIEVFQLNTEDINNIKIQYVESLQLPKYLNGSANDILFLGNNEYLVTQWLADADDLNDSRRIGLAAGLKQAKMVFDLTLNRKVTEVFSCVSDENKQMNCVVVKSASGEMNNGISWDLENQIFVADSFGKTVTLYNLDLQADRSERLKFQQQIQTNCHPDNIEYDRYLKQIITGGFGKAYQYFEYVDEHKKIHPQYTETVSGLWNLVDRIQFDENNKLTIENLMTRDDVYRGLTVVLQYKDQFLMGSFMDKSLATCDIKGINSNKPHIHTALSFFKSLLPI